MDMENGNSQDMNNDNVSNENMNDEERHEELHRRMNRKDCSKENRKGGSGNTTGGALYFVGFIGAAVYYISVATTFWGGVAGFLKALVWPAFLVFDTLKFISK